MGALDDGERIRAADAAVWRAWLAENHERTGGVWLLSVRGASDGVGYEDAVRHALCFGWIDGPVRVFDDGTNDRASGQWFSPRRPGSGWAATNKARIAELEAAGLPVAGSAASDARLAHDRSGRRRPLRPVLRPLDHMQLGPQPR